jgi:tRNA(fMet)-specific endonuclease VapC
MVIERLRRKEPEDVALSTITLAELYYSVEKSTHPVRNRFALMKFLFPFTIMAFDDSSALTYGRIRVHMEKTGSIIDSLDLLIGAQAVAAGLTLVTNNVREFSRIPDLHLENWAD